ncbi:MAG: TIGR04372 family glycosyltransferase [Actinomycetota bacterium]|nr:TIGR04372 family glycosyltransferase [Actinomycetota bacterium]
MTAAASGAPDAEPSKAKRIANLVSIARKLGVRESRDIVDDGFTHMLSRLRVHSQAARKGSSHFVEARAYREFQAAQNTHGQLYASGNFEAHPQAVLHAASLLKQARVELGLEDFPIRILGGDVSHSIGHIAIGLGTRVKLRAVGLEETPRPIVIASQVPNKHYLEYFRPHFPISYVSTWVASDLRNRLWPLFASIDWVDTARGPLMLYEASTLADAGWEELTDRPLLELTKEDRDRGADFLSSIGLSAEDWFVTLHIRDNPRSGQGYGRNADADSYLLGVQEIVRRGGKVIRLAPPGAKALPEMDGLVDLAAMGPRPDWVDVFLLGACAFLIGTTSGPHMVASTFGRPVLLTNVTGLALAPIPSRTLVLPKLVRRVASGGVSTLSELLDLGAAHVDGFLTGVLAEPQDPYAWVDNSPEELLVATIEMLDGAYDQAPSQMQAEFQQILRQHGNLRPAPVSESFLARHR